MAGGFVCRCRLYLPPSMIHHRRHDTSSISLHIATRRCVKWCCCEGHNCGISLVALPSSALPRKPHTLSQLRKHYHGDRAAAIQLTNHERTGNQGEFDIRAGTMYERRVSKTQHIELQKNKNLIQRLLFSIHCLSRHVTSIHSHNRVVP
jgi:hypothetical protein